MPADEPALRQLDQIAAARRMKPKDCRDCRNYQASEDAMAYGWCNKQFVKLYHPQRRLLLAVPAQEPAPRTARAMSSARRTRPRLRSGGRASDITHAHC